MPSCSPSTRGWRGSRSTVDPPQRLQCHENVRLAHPLAPNEIRAAGQVDFRLDGTRRRMERFVARVWDGS
ncbi:hypothetical protein CTI14_51910 [Methylobacterium radiotolerans]|nr:hypothetical protein CTI14_51910 [Methylobacterium radiotolerans]